MDPAGYYYLIKEQRSPNFIIYALNQALLLESNEYHFQSPTIMPLVDYDEFSFDGGINDALREDDKNVLMIVPSSAPSTPCAALVYSYKRNEKYGYSYKRDTGDEMGTIYVDFLASNKRQTSMCGGSGQSLIKIFIDAAETITEPGKTIQIKLYDAAKNKNFYRFAMSPKDVNGYRTHNTGHINRRKERIPLTRQASGPHSIVYKVDDFEKGDIASLIRDVLVFPPNNTPYPSDRARVIVRTETKTRSVSPSKWNHPSQRTGRHSSSSSGSSSGKPYIVSMAPFKGQTLRDRQAELNIYLKADKGGDYTESVNFLIDNFHDKRDIVLINSHIKCSDDEQKQNFKTTLVELLKRPRAKGITKRKTKKRKRNPRKRITHNLKRRH